MNSKFKIRISIVNRRIVSSFQYTDSGTYRGPTIPGASAAQGGRGGERPPNVEVGGFNLPTVHVHDSNIWNDPSDNGVTGT